MRGASKRRWRPGTGRSRGSRGATRTRRSRRTEPVGDDLLQAAGTVNLTPFTLQADIMNGVDPAPQDVTRQEALLSAPPRQGPDLQPAGHRLADAVVPRRRRGAHGIPVVGVYETMPTPAYDYQSWMLAEVHALRNSTRAVADRKIDGADCDDEPTRVRHRDPCATIRARPSRGVTVRARRSPDACSTTSTSRSAAASSRD